ncbi:hypothetical protein GOODEAATRI_014559, partial [Goodea atripinnis]
NKTRPELLEGAEWGADLPSVENNLQEHNTIHTAVEELLSSLQEARSYEEHSSCRLQSLESLQAFVCRCTEELIWLNEREEEEISFDWSDNNTNMGAKREMYNVVEGLLTVFCMDPPGLTLCFQAYSAALQTQWQWVQQLCVCVEQHLKDNTAYFQEEKEQLIEYRSTVASLMGRAKTVVQLRPRSTEGLLGGATPIRAICDYKQIELCLDIQLLMLFLYLVLGSGRSVCSLERPVSITINQGEECVLEDNSQRTKWKVISPTGNEAMVPSVCFTVPPPNQEAIDTSSRSESHSPSLKLLGSLEVSPLLTCFNRQVRSQSPSERQRVLDHLGSQLADFLSDSKESSLFTAAERRDLEREVQQAQQHCQDLLHNMETGEDSMMLSFDITLRLNESERTLISAIETPPPSRLSAGSFDITLQIAEQEKLKSELDSLRSSLGDVSHRCVRFFEEKPSSSSVPQQEHIFQALQVQVGQAKEAGAQLSKLHPDRSPELERYQERANQIAERWTGIKSQTETR